MGTLLPREKHKAAYDKALVQRYQHMPDIRRIARHRHVPAAIYKVRAAGHGRESLGQAVREALPTASSH